MPFSEPQLETWSSQGAIASSATTYNSIKACIDEVNWKDDISYKIYLQGSYKNSTNIRGNSDVDVIAEFTSGFYSNKSRFSQEALREFNEVYSDGKYSLSDFKTALIEKFQDYYGKENVIVGNRAIKIKGNNGRLNADITCCSEYREYKSFNKTNRGNYEKGIVFWEVNTGNEVINFPVQHYDNGVLKNQNSSNNYKAATRIIKNMKSRMVEQGSIINKLAPSYFVEGLLYNVPNNTFSKTNYHDIIVGLLNNLNNKTDDDLTKFICQNRQRPLFGDSDQQWNINDCKLFLEKIIAFWNKG